MFEAAPTRVIGVCPGCNLNIGVVESRGRSDEMWHAAPFCWDFTYRSSADYAVWAADPDREKMTLEDINSLRKKLKDKLKDLYEKPMRRASDLIPLTPEQARALPPYVPPKPLPAPASPFRVRTSTMYPKKR